MQTPSKTMTLSAMLSQPTSVVHEQTDAGDAGARIEAVASLHDRLEGAATREQRSRQRQEQEPRTLESPHDAVRLRGETEDQYDRAEVLFESVAPEPHDGLHPLLAETARPGFTEFRGFTAVAAFDDDMDCDVVM